VRALQKVGPRSVVAALTIAGGIGALRRWSLGHGATDDERAMPLPGDDQVPEPNLVATRAITIHVSPARVWPWLVQLGQGRAGFYSYTALENLFGADLHNADQVDPQWQNLAVGDAVNLAPGMPLDAVVVEPDHALVLGGGVPTTGSGPPFTFSWAFVLLAAGDDACRLVVRERYGYTRRWSALVVEPTELVSFLMSQRMLRGIRDRAERPLAAASPA
jgi:hypothetical protein